MILRLQRKISNERATLGLLSMDGVFSCYTLEDEARVVKVAGETRIPAGEYAIGVRKYGKFYDKYTERFSWHRGMLEVKDVPKFTDILIHLGNTDKDTAGCILVGAGATLGAVNYALLDSTGAYVSLYKKVIDEAEKGTLKLTIEDEK